MRFWDSSGLVAIVVEEQSSRAVRQLAVADPELMAWTLSEAEIASALWRRRRGDELTEAQRSEAQRQMDLILGNAVIVTDVSSVIRRARRLLAAHNLRAADAMQLGAALLGSEDDPSRFSFVTVDDRLAEAASGEGFSVVP